MQSIVEFIDDKEKLNGMYKLAEFMSKGNLFIPPHFRNNPTDCFALVLLATRLNIDPFALAQKTYMVKGRLGMEGQLVNALVMNSGFIIGGFLYEYTGWDGDKEGEIRTGAVLKGDTKPTWGEWIDVSKVEVRMSQQWKTNPRQQAAYLAVRMWARLYCPTALMGIYTEEELHTVKDVPQEKEVKPLREMIENDSDRTSRLI